MPSIIVNGKEIQAPSSLDLKNFKETGEEFVHYPRPGIKVKKIILHWTGGENGLDGVERTLRTRKFGAHFIIDVDGTIQQYVDTDHTTYHAGGANQDSIGFEIVNKGFASQPTAEGREEYSANLLGKNVKLTTFTKEQIEATKKIVKFLCGIYNIPYNVPLNDKGELLTDRRFTEFELANYSGVCGHYHVDIKKEVKIDPGIDLLSAILNDSKFTATQEDEVPSEESSDEPNVSVPEEKTEKYESLTQGRADSPDGKTGYSITSKEDGADVDSLDKDASGIISLVNKNNIIENPFIRFNKQISQMRNVSTLDLSSVVPVIKIFAFPTEDDSNLKTNKEKNLIDLNELIFSTPSLGEDALSSKYDFSYSNPERPIASIKNLSINLQPPSVGGPTGITIVKLGIKIHNFDLVNKDHPKGKYIAFLLRQNYHVRIRYGAESSYQEQYMKDSFQWVEQDFFTARHDITVNNDLSMDVNIELLSAEQKLFNQVLIGESLPAELISESDKKEIINSITSDNGKSIDSIKDLELSIKIYNKQVLNIGINDEKKEDGTIASVLHGTIKSKDFENQLNAIPPVRKSNLINGLKTIQSRLLTKKYEQLLERYCYNYSFKSAANGLQYPAVNLGPLFMSLVMPEIKNVIKQVNSSNIKIGTINSSNYGSLSDNRNDVALIFGNFNAAAAQWAGKPLSTFPVNIENLFSYLREERDVGQFSNSINSFINKLTSFLQDSAHYVVDDNFKKLSKPQLKFSLYPNPYYETNGLPAWIMYVYDSMSVAVDFSLALESLNEQPLTKDDAKSKLESMNVPFIEPGTNYSLIKNMSANTMADDLVASAIFRQANAQAYNQRQLDASNIPTGISREFYSGFQLDINKNVAEQNILYPLQVSIDHYFMSSAILYGHVYIFFPTNLFSGIYLIDQVTHELSNNTLSTRLSLKMQPTRVNILPQ